jgi:hypothetical protein
MAEIGEKIFYENPITHEIESSIIIGIEPCGYVDDDGKIIDFNMYKVGPYEEIEDYNCIPKNHPKVVKYLAGEDGKYSEDDKKKRDILEYIMSRGWALTEDSARGFLFRLFNCYAE